MLYALIAIGILVYLLIGIFIAIYKVDSMESPVDLSFTVLLWPVIVLIRIMESTGTLIQKAKEYKGKRD